MIIQTHSGGPGATAADACGRIGLDLPAFSEETVKKLKPFVPGTGSLNNPLDITFAKNPLDYFNGIPQALLADPRAEGLLMYLMLPDGQMENGLRRMGLPEDQIPDQLTKFVEQTAQALMELPETYQKPVVGFSYRARTDRLIGVLQNKGFPVFPSPERAARAMAALVRYRSFQEKLFRRTDI